jgi:SAM-dependent methyltransferase
MGKLAADFYERYGSEWSEPARRTAERRVTEYKVDRLASLMAGVRPKSIIDFGCGLGDALDLLAERFQPDSTIGIDLSTTMLAHARVAYPNREFIQGSVERLRDFQVDLITFFDVLEHLEDIPSALEAARGSACYVGIKIPLEKTWFVAMLNKLGLKEPRSRLYETEGHLYEFNHREVEALVRRCGLSIVNSRVDFTPKAVHFSDYMKARMRAKPGASGTIKSFLYEAMSLMPYAATRPVFETVNGTDLFLLCRSTNPCE